MKKQVTIILTGNLKQDLPIMKALVRAGYDRSRKRKNYFDDELPRLEKCLGSAIKKKG